MTDINESDVWIDDVKLQDMGVRVRLSSDEPFLPATRNQTVTIPGRHGQYDFGAFFDSREFRLDCVTERQADYAEMKRRLSELSRLFIDEYGRPKMVKLRFGDAPDRYFNVRLGGVVPLERLAKIGQFTLPLIAHDPYAYGEEQEHRSVTNLTRVINNAGHLVADSVIRITSLEGQVQSLDMGGEDGGNDDSNPALQDVTITLNGENFEIEGVINELVIDTKNMTVTDSGNNLFDRFKSDITKFKLRTGNNNLRVSDATGSYGFYQISYKGRWVI